MSQIGNIEAALLADAAAAVSGLTTEQGDRNLDDISASEYPFAFSVVSGVDVEALTLDQQGDTVEVTIFLVLAGETETHETLLTKLEAIRAQIQADPTLGGVVDDTPEVGIGPLEEIEGGTRRVGFVVAQTRKATGGDLAAGATGYELRVHVAALDEGGNANTSYDRLVVSLIVHHRLADATDERAYTEGNMLTHQKAVVAPAYWRDLAAVYDVAEGIEAQAAERDGSIITWAVSGFELRLVPGQTAATAAGQMETALDATLSGSRLASDYRS